MGTLACSEGKEGEGKGRVEVISCSSWVVGDRKLLWIEKKAKVLVGRTLVGLQNLRSARRASQSPLHSGQTEGIVNDCCYFKPLVMGHI